MVLGFLRFAAAATVVALLILACSDFDRDSIYDTRGSGATYELCGTNWDRLLLTSQICDGGIIKTECGVGGVGGYYDSTDTGLRCENEVIETRCGDEWYNTENDSLQCAANDRGWWFVQKKCNDDGGYNRDGWYNRIDTDLRCQNKVIEWACGTSWYNANNDSLRCVNNIVVTECGNDWYNKADTTSRCEKQVVETKCGTGWYDAKDNNFRCEKQVIQTACGHNWYDAKTEYCYNGNSNRIIGKLSEKCGTRPEAFNTALYECKEAKIISLKKTATQPYDAVLIGEQTWMTDNLNIATVEGSACYGGDAANCTKYGRLYNYDTALVVCPAGWHLPSAEEWIELNADAAVSTYSYAKGGFGSPGGSFFLGIDEEGAWWSTDDKYFLGYDSEGVYKGDSDKNMLLSVRCVRD